MMLELRHWEPNSFSLAGLIALNEKGAPFRSVWVDWLDLTRDASAQPNNLESLNNPETEGPILIDGDRIISESFFMLEYIDQVCGGEVSLVPPDPRDKWRVRVWGRILGERTAPAVCELGCHRYLAPAMRQPRPSAVEQFLAALPTEERRAAWRAALEDSYPDEELEDCRRRVREIVQRIEAALAGSDWLLPSGYSAADIYAFALTNALPKLTPDLCNHEVAPRMGGWLERMRARAAVKASLATSRTGRPDEAFAPGPDHARWG